MHCASTSAVCRRLSDGALASVGGGWQTDIHRRGARKGGGFYCGSTWEGCLKEACSAGEGEGGSQRGEAILLSALSFLKPVKAGRLLNTERHSLPARLDLSRRRVSDLYEKINEQLINYSSNSCIMHFPRHLVATSKLSDFDLGRRGGQY